MQLDSGARDRYILLQQRTQGTGKSGRPTEGWSTLTNTWASKTDASGQERLTSAQLSSAVDTVWEIPYREDMDPEVVDVPKMRRLVYRGRAYDIVSAKADGRSEGITLLTIARTVNDAD